MPSEASALETPGRMPRRAGFPKCSSGRPSPSRAHPFASCWHPGRRTSQNPRCVPQKPKGR
eukprot:5955978-Pleurochrysis_carterae.AAC.1